ncbi:MAG: glycogen synthase [Oscillospiraceae bacterium]|nr:glycogen synthase [Oscillospiraceae bacterium]
MKKEFQSLLSEKKRRELPKILLVSAECAPLSKTGGLADVVGALPRYLQKLDVDARVITPYHRCIKEKYAAEVEHLFSFYVDLGWRHQYAGIERLVFNGIIIYLVDSEFYFGDTIYRGGYAEGEQYAFFTRAVMDALPNLDFTPDILHCNDWHASMLPMLGKTQYPGCMQEKLKYLLSIHNIAFQGRYDFGYVQDLLRVDPKYYTSEIMELWGAADFLKAGCYFADKISTVSPSYAEEIKTDYYSEGLGAILNARASDLCGILNGIDAVTFNPAEDAMIPAHYTSADRSGKAKCKTGLQERLGLEVRDDLPILAMVTRMTEQKGFELVMEKLEDIMENESLQYVLLGTGDSRYEDYMRYMEERYKGRLVSYIGYNEELAHQIYAGSDFFLMPSRFEPCGLSQMISMRYGCLPIVRETGGLKDTVIPLNSLTKEGTGFTFAGFDAGEMRAAVHEAIACYDNREVMDELVSNAMSVDFSFERSAEDYIRLYISMLDAPESDLTEEKED